MVDPQREARDPGYLEDAWAEDHPTEEFDLVRLEDRPALLVAIAQARRDAARAVEWLDRDTRVWGSPDRNRQQRARDALAYLNWICSPVALAEVWE